MTIKSDRTYSQDPRFHIQPSRKNKFYSIDLTAATDRFPLKLQIQILTLLIGKEKAES